jgi:hypothetical protein
MCPLAKAFWTPLVRVWLKDFETSHEIPPMDFRGRSERPGQGELIV